MKGGGGQRFQMFALYIDPLYISFELYHMNDRFNTDAC